MSYQFDDDSSDYNDLNDKIKRLQRDIDAIPVRSVGSPSVVDPFYSGKGSEPVAIGQDVHINNIPVGAEYEGYYLRVHKEAAESFVATWQNITLHHLGEWYPNDDPRREKPGTPYLLMPFGSEIWGLGWLKFNTPFSAETKVGGFETLLVNFSEENGQVSKFENVLNFNVLGQKAMAISAISDANEIRRDNPENEVVEVFGQGKPLLKLVDTKFYLSPEHTTDIGSIYFDAQATTSTGLDQVTFAEIKGQAERDESDWPAWNDATIYLKGDHVTHGGRAWELVLPFVLRGGSAPSEPFSEDERVWAGSSQRITLDRGKLEFVLRDVEDHDDPGTNAHFNTILSLDVDHGIFVNSHLTTAHGAYTNLNGRVNLGADIGATINMFAPVNALEPLTVAKHINVGRYINLGKIIRGTAQVGDIWVEDTSLEGGGTSTDVKVQTGDKTVNLSSIGLSGLTEPIVWTNDTMGKGTLGGGTADNSKSGINVPNSNDMTFKVKDNKKSFKFGGGHSGYFDISLGRIRFVGSSLDTKLNTNPKEDHDNGTIWMDSSGNVKVRTGSKNVNLGSIGDTPSLSGLTSPISWTTVTDPLATGAKTGGAEGGNNIGFDNDNDYYIKMKGDTMIVKSGTTDLFEIKNNSGAKNTQQGVTDIIADGFIKTRLMLNLQDAGNVNYVTRTNGEIWRDGDHIAAYSGGDTRNLSDIGKKPSLIGLNGPISWSFPVSMTDKDDFVVEDPHNRAQVGADKDGNLNLTSRDDQRVNIITGSGGAAATFFNNQLVLGSGPDGTAQNNSIFRRGNNVHIMTGNRDLNLSNLHGQVGDNVVPSLGINNFDQDALERTFSAGPGSIAIVQITPPDTASLIGTTGAYIIIRNNDSWWYLDNPVRLNTDGIQNNVPIVPNKRILFIDSGSNRGYDSTDLRNIGGWEDGKIFMHQPIYDSSRDDVEYPLKIHWLFRSQSDIEQEKSITPTYYGNTHANSEYTGTISPTLLILPTFYTTTITGAILDGVLGTRSGSMGINIANGRLYYKYNVEWWSV